MDIIQIRRDTVANWKLYNPILSLGEVGIITSDATTISNPMQFKVGNGQSTWIDLPTCVVASLDATAAVYGFEVENTISVKDWASIVSNAVTLEDYLKSREEEVKKNIFPITTDKLADGAITEDKLASQSVSSKKIKDATIGTSKLGENSVTTTKIKDGAVSEAKLDSNVTSKINNSVKTVEQTLTDDEVKIASKNLKFRDNNGNLFADSVSYSSAFKEGVSNSSIFGTFCRENTFGVECYANVCGNNFQYNELGVGCSSNTFGNDCRSNTLGGDCNNNTFGNGCKNNTLKGLCSHNILENGCEYNDLGVKAISVHLGNGVSYTVLKSNASGWGKPLQNIRILSGVRGKSQTERLTINIPDEYLNSSRELIITTKVTNGGPSTPEDLVMYYADEVVDKQNKQDTTLETTSKEVVGAINELFNGGVKDKSIVEAKLSEDLQDKLKRMQDKLFPLTLSASIKGNTVYELGASADIVVNWNVAIDGEKVAPDRFTINGEEIDSITVANGTKTYNSVTQTTKYEIVAEKDGSTVSTTLEVRFVSPSYLGVVNSSVTIDEIANMLGGEGFVKKLLTSRTCTYTFMLDNKKACYAYPAAYGTLTTIKDSNNFDYIGSYDSTSTSVNGVNYNIYLLKDATTISSFVQKYS